MSHRRTINCPNCGAPLNDFEANNCGTIVQDFTLMDESKPFYLRFKFCGTIYTFRAGLKSVEWDMSTDSVPTFTFGVFCDVYIGITMVALLHAARHDDD